MNISKENNQVPPTREPCLMVPSTPINIRVPVMPNMALVFRHPLLCSDEALAHNRDRIKQLADYIARLESEEFE